MTTASTPEHRAGPAARRPAVSLVVPILNEVETLPAFHARARDALVEAGEDYEMVFVDDGSTDGSLDVLRALAADDPRIRVVSFSRNFGHQTAVTAGLHRAAGDHVAVIDGDLQDPPELVPKMVARAREGHDVVYAVRRSRAEGLPMRTAYRVFYRLLRRVSYLDIPPDSGDFAVMSRRVVDLLNEMPERDRFVRGIRAWVGFRQTGYPYDRDERYAGTSKYPFGKLVRLASDGLISYSYLPLRVVTQLGFVISLAAFLLMLVLIVLRIATGQLIVGWTSTLVVIMFLGGVQLICLGTMGEYVGRIFDEVKRRPLYVVRETLGFEPEDVSGRRQGG